MKHTSSKTGILFTIGVIIIATLYAFGIVSKDIAAYVSWVILGLFAFVLWLKLTIENIQKITNSERKYNDDV